MNGWHYILFECDRAHALAHGRDHEGMAFPSHIPHADFARRFPEWTPLNAGHLAVNAVDSGGEHYAVHVKCHGKADTLNLNADPLDADFFNEP